MTTVEDARRSIVLERQLDVGSDELFKEVKRFLSNRSQRGEHTGEYDVTRSFKNLLQIDLVTIANHERTPLGYIELNPSSPSRARVVMHHTKADSAGLMKRLAQHIVEWSGSNGEQQAAGEPLTKWSGNGEPPKTRVGKIKAVQAWDNLNPDDRPPLTDWLEASFGLNLDGSLAVAESTFHGWRKYIPKNS